MIRKLDEGKNKIDFMRLFGVITTNKLYKEIKKIFELYDDIKEFEDFKKRLIKNTKNSFTSTYYVDNTKENTDNKDNFVYLYALDFFLVNKYKEYFNISSDKEAYILNISYYLKKFDDDDFLRKLVATYSENPNINISNIKPIYIENNNCFTDDIDLLINTAIYLKSKGKIPIIVTFNNYNYVRCLSYDIYFCSNITDELEEKIKNKNEKEEEDTSLPYIFFDSSSIISLNKNQTHFDKIGFINNILKFSLKHPNISIASEDLEIIEYAILNKLKLSKIE